MQMAKEKEKPFMSDKELIVSLMVISEAANNLAMEVMLSPCKDEGEESKDGGEGDAT